MIIMCCRFGQCIVSVSSSPSRVTAIGYVVQSSVQMDVSLCLVVMTRPFACGTGTADSVCRLSTSTLGEEGVWSGVHVLGIDMYTVQ